MEKELSAGTKMALAEKEVVLKANGDIKTPAKEKVTIDKDDLDVILNRLEKLEAKNQLKKATVNSKDTVTIAFYEGKPVIGFGQYSQTLDHMNEPVLWLELKVKGIADLVKIKYTDINRVLERREATVVSRDTTPVIEEIVDHSTGRVMEIERREVRGYATRSLGYTVPMTVESTETTFHLSFDDGSVLTVGEDVVNI